MKTKAVAAALLAAQVGHETAVFVNGKFQPFQPRISQSKRRRLTRRRGRS